MQPRTPLPLWEAATLLETLLQHFVDKEGSAHSLGQVDSSGVVRRLVLAEAVPATAFQQQAASLTELLPPSQPPTHCYTGADDWLDADLGELIRDPLLPKEWRAIFSGLACWHTCSPRPSYQWIDIYTDGSAGTAQDTKEVVGPCSWAFTVWASTPCQSFFVGWAAHTAVPTDTTYHIGEEADDALSSELLAIAWACIWAIEFGGQFHAPLRFLFDCSAAGGGVAGSARLPRSPASTVVAPLAAFAAALRQRLALLLPVSFEHVRGHAGSVGNELADQLAKQARRSREDIYQRLLPDWPHKVFRHPLRAWMWLAGISSAALPWLPALEGEAHRMQQLPGVCTHAPSMGVRQCTQSAGDVRFLLRFATYNVLTLFDPATVHGRKARAAAFGMMISGKRDLLKSQMHAQGLWAMGLQETRLPESAVLPDGDFVMLCSGATPSGSYGCALWVNLRAAFAFVEGEPRYVSKDQLLVTGYSPRHILVQVDTPWLRLTVLVAHGPSAEGGDTTEARAFWGAMLVALQRRPQSSHVVLLVDANGRLGSVPTDLVGSCDSETECPVGTVFHEFLHAVQCFVPSTFADCHVGQSWTWISPSVPPVQRRIDYICVPVSWGAFAVSTHVWTDVESLQVRQDHLPLIMQADFCRASPPLVYSRSSRQACRPSVDADRVERGAFLQALVTQPEVEWHLPVDQHFSQLVADFWHASGALDRQAPPQPRQCYLSAETLVLVRQRAALRVYIRQENAECSRRLLLICFAAFLHHAGRGAWAPDAAGRAASWLAQIDVSVARAVAALNRSTAAIRQAVKLDRVAYLQGLVANVALCDLRSPKRLFAAVRRAFPAARSARTSSLLPLPAIRLEDGTLATTPAERTQRWRDFFGSQEAGVAVSALGYQAAFERPDIPVFRLAPTLVCLISSLWQMWKSIFSL